MFLFRELCLAECCWKCPALSLLQTPRYLITVLQLKYVNIQNIAVLVVYLEFYYGKVSKIHARLAGGFFPQVGGWGTASPLRKMILEKRVGGLEVSESILVH